MLYLIGLGLNDEKDISLKGIELLADCDKIYCEFYTNVWNGNLKIIENKVKKNIVLLSREQVESDFLIKEAKTSRIALLVPGDPLTATTHMELIIECKKHNIPAEVVHAGSIYTAIAGTGLQLYKMGRVTTLPKPQKNFNPTSQFDPIKENKKAGLHSLILLDIGMTATEGLELLSKNGFSKENVVVCCRLGSSFQVIKYGTVSSLLKEKSLEKSPSVLILPGSLHFKEEEALNLWK